MATITEVKETIKKLPDEDFNAFADWFEKLEEENACDETLLLEKVNKTEISKRYINDIYATDAQASGLLVIASYNWGEHNVGKLVRKLISEMPNNPKDRNFWRLLEKHRKNFPDETYNYVFYIFSAAVIGENQRLFGFNFDNPLDSINLQLN